MNAKVCHDINGGWFNNLMCPVSVEEQPEGTLPDIETINKAKHIIRSRFNKTKPIFLSVGLHKPHVPFRFPRQYLGKTVDLF
jgi:iduronate 2-sulfatase